MKSLRTILAIAMLAPFASPAAHYEQAGDDRSFVAAAPAATVESATAGYDCCYVWILGQWWCIPC